MKIILERYKNYLASLLAPSKETSQMIALNSILEFWVNSEWHVNVYIQTFLEYKLLKPTVVISWVFKNLDKSSMRMLEDNVYWNVLESLVDKTFTKIEFYKEELKKVSYY